MLLKGYELATHSSKIFKHLIEHELAVQNAAGFLRRSVPADCVFLLLANDAADDLLALYFGYPAAVLRGCAMRSNFSRGGLEPARKKHERLYCIEMLISIRAFGLSFHSYTGWHVVRCAEWWRGT